MNKWYKTTFVASGILSVLLVGLAFVLMFVGYDKAVSFVAMLLAIGGIFGGMSLASYVDYRNAKNNKSVTNIK